MVATKTEKTESYLLGKGNKQLLQECIHCGLCLPTCPTYAVNGMEMDSPRGRLYLMDSVLRGKIKPSKTFIKHIELCLTCRACETACPSGVNFHQLMDSTRQYIYQKRTKYRVSNWFSSLLLRNIIPSHLTLSIASKLIWIYQRSGIQWLTTNTSFKYLLPGKLRLLQTTLPRIPFKRFGKNKTLMFPATGEKKGRVALFTECVMDHLFPGVHNASIRILNWNGYEVVIPKEQTCCGAIHNHNGDHITANHLAQINHFAFNDDTFESIVVDAAGCGAQLKENLIASNNGNERQFRPRIEDITEFLARIKFRNPQSHLNLKVVFDEPCHLIHAQGISEEPKYLIRQIPGIDLLTLPEADYCCGSAGTYTASQTKMSLNILDRKMKFVKQSKANYLVTANPGCQIQLDWGVRRHKLAVKVLHIVELLDMAYKNDDGYPDYLLN